MSALTFNQGLTVPSLLQVQMRMQTLKERLFQHVSAVLEASEESPAAALVRTGRWKSVWDKAVRFLAPQHGSGNAQAAELQATLGELHQDIQNQISAEVRASMTASRPRQCTCCGCKPCTRASSGVIALRMHGTLVGQRRPFDLCQRVITS